MSSHTKTNGPAKPFKVKVLVKPRPTNPSDASTAASDASTLQKLYESNGLGEAFPSTLSSHASQGDLYAYIDADIQRVISGGERAIVMGYGPTGSGKTRCLTGTPDSSPGILQRAAKLFFAEASKQGAEVTFEARFIHLEVYLDLFAPSQDSSRRPLSAQGNERKSNKSDMFGMRSEKGYFRTIGGIKKCLTSEESLEEAIKEANSKRIMEKTALNEGGSSRGHTIYELSLVEGTSALTVVDLAGSEPPTEHARPIGADREKKDDAWIKKRTEEGIKINQQLLELEVFIQELTKGGYFNHRGSTLKQALSEALTQSHYSYLVLAINLNPAQETSAKSALKFARKFQAYKPRPADRGRIGLDAVAASKRVVSGRQGGGDHRMLSRGGGMSDHAVGEDAVIRIEELLQKITESEQTITKLRGENMTLQQKVDDLQATKASSTLTHTTTDNDDNVAPRKSTARSASEVGLEDDDVRHVKRRRAGEEEAMLIAKLGHDQGEGSAGEESQLRVLEQRLASLDTERRRLAAERDDTRRQIDELAAHRNDLQEQLRQAGLECIRLKKGWAEESELRRGLRAELDLCNEKKERSENQLETERHQHRRLAEEHRQTVQRCESSKSDSDVARKRTEAEQSSLNEINLRQSKEIAEMKVELERSREEIVMLEARVNGLAKLEADITAKENLVRELRSELGSKDVDILRLKARLKTWEGDGESGSLAGSGGDCETCSESAGMLCRICASRDLYKELWRA